MRYKTQDSSSVGYAPLNITVFEANQDNVKKLTNTAPFFLKQPESKIKMLINDEPRSRVWVFPEMFDISGDEIHVRIEG